ncbi:MAG: CsgG/HfaB family protein [Verrucomicrobiota bacterium]
MKTGIKFVTGILKTGLVVLLATPTMAQQKDTIGVAAIDVNSSVEQEAAKRGKTTEMKRTLESLDNQLIDRLNASRKFQVIARSDLEKLLREQQLVGSGNVNQNDPNAAKSFKLAGVKYLLVTSIDDYQDMTQSANLADLGKTIHKRILRISAIGKIYDTTSGKLLESANLQTTLTNITQILNEVRVEGTLSDELSVNLARTLAEKIANRVADVIFPAKVLAKFDRQITINRGDGGGVSVDQLWNVYAVGEELKDPDTGEVLGRQEVLMGQAKIISVQPKTSTAELLEDRGVTVGSVLRIPQAQKP